MSSFGFMETEMEVWLSPTDPSRWGGGLTADCCCVVLDVLRATSSIVAALAAGAECVEPVVDIPTAVARWRQDPSILLAGERGGRRIRAGTESPVDFHLGNSPREFIPERVRGKKIVLTTTNGTKVIDTVRGAGRVYAGAWVNVSVLIDRLLKEHWKRLVIVCAGTEMRTALEDVYVAGALVVGLWRQGHERKWKWEDGAKVAAAVYQWYGETARNVFQSAQNGIRLSQIPEVAEDVAWCAVKDRFAVVPVLGQDGCFRLEALKHSSF